MAEADLKLAYDAVRGKRSTYIYRHQKGKTFFHRRPVVDTVSPAMAEVRRRFRAAADYVRDVLADPALRAAYEPLAEAQKARISQVIMTDYLRSPVIDDIDLGSFSGAVGSTFKVRALDDCGVMSVAIEIRAADDTLLEQGAATKVGSKWVYAATVAHPEGTPITITATAVDRPGNKGTKAVTWG